VLAGPLRRAFAWTLESAWALQSPGEGVDQLEAQLIDSAVHHKPTDGLRSVEQLTYQQAAESVSGSLLPVAPPYRSESLTCMTNNCERPYTAEMNWVVVSTPPGSSSTERFRRSKARDDFSRLFGC
jgi:hypothetical protein